MLNLYAGWTGLLLCAVFGAIQGLFFHKANWLGGYNTWPRRMTRLGHISLFGIGIINLAFGLTVKTLKIEGGINLSSYLLVVGLITMPLICYLSAVKQAFRHLFFIPTISVISAIIIFIWRLGQ